MTERDLLPFLRAHECFRRDFERLRTTLESDQVVFDESRSAALAWHWRGLSAVLEHHHENEDRAIFPKVASTFPSAAEALRGLEEEHVRLVELLEKAATVMPRVRTERAAATELAKEMEALVGDHLDAEEREIVPLFSRCFSGEEWARMEARTTEELREAGLFPFVLPWITEGMDEATVRIALDGFGSEARESYHRSWQDEYARQGRLLWAESGAR